MNITAKELGDQPAMPNISGDASGIGCCTNEQGLTKREEFAKAAMQGLSANPANWTTDQVASYAVNQADALLTELAKEQPEGGT